jgi:hypothetical protein
MHDRLSRMPHSGVDLHDLPVFAPDAAVWLRLQAAQVARMRVRRRWRGGVAAAGGLAAAAMFAAVLLLPRVQPLPPLQQNLVAGQHESRTLEAEWQRMTESATGSIRPVARLRAIDASLQAAYDRGAADEELAPLWQQRNRALRGLISRTQEGSASAAGTTRI